MRRGHRSGPTSRGDLVVAVTAGAAIAGVGASLDSQWLVGIVVRIGFGLAIWLGRRRAG